MKQLTVLLFIFLILFFAGCNKKKSSSGTDCKISVIQNNVSDTTYLTYDAQNRVTTYTNSDNSSADFTFNYTGLTGTASITASDTSYHQNVNMFLNANGTLSSMNIVTSSGGFTFSYTYSYTYDSDGHIVLCNQSLRQNGTFSTEYYKDSLVYLNGNMIAKYSYARTDANPFSLTHYIEISYNNDLNKAGYYIWGYDEEPTSVLSGFTPYFHLYGKSSTNLPAVTNYYNSTGVLQYSVAYSFLLNENGYPVEENLNRTLLYPFTINRKFTYSCN